MVGVLAGGLIGNPRTLGLDAIFPAFFLGLLVAELRRPRARPVAALGAVIALVLTPLTPAGVPIIVAAAAVFVAAGFGAMTVVWITVAGLCVTTAAIKAFGPVVFGGRDLPGLLARAIPLLAPALLAALVVTETVGGTGPLAGDRRAARRAGGGGDRDLAPVAAGRRRARARRGDGAAARRE